MNELVHQVRHDLGQDGKMIRIPEWLGMLGGYGFDIAAKLSGKNYQLAV